MSNTDDIRQGVKIGDEAKFAARGVLNARGMDEILIAVQDAINAAVETAVFAERERCVASVRTTLLPTPSPTSRIDPEALARTLERAIRGEKWIE